MAKKIVTIQKLDDMARTEGFSSGTVKTRFFNRYGSAYTGTRCPNKGEILSACSGLINPISYYPTGSSQVATNYLVPEDEITFDGYDTREVSLIINNIGQQHNISNGAFNINVFYDDKNGNITNIGGGRFPNDDYEISPGESWEALEYPLITKIKKSALTSNGRMDFSITYEGYYAQFADESWFDFVDDDTEHVEYGFQDLNLDELITYDDGSTYVRGYYYPLHSLTINSALANPVVPPVETDTITMTVDINNYSSDYMGSAEVGITLYDSTGNQVLSTNAPAVAAGESASKNIKFNIERIKNVLGCSIEFTWYDTYELSCDFAGVHVEGDSPLTINNVVFNNFNTIEIFR